MKDLTFKQFVYIVQAESTPHFKIGTTSDMKARLRSIQTGCPYNVILREKLRQRLKDRSAHDYQPCALTLPRYDDVY